MKTLLKIIFITLITLFSCNCLYSADAKYLIGTANGYIAAQDSVQGIIIEKISNCSIQWRWILYYPNYWTKVNSIDINSYGEILVTGSTTYPDSIGKSEYWKLDSSGNYIWGKYLTFGAGLPSSGLYGRFVNDTSIFVISGVAGFQGISHLNFSSLDKFGNSSGTGLNYDFADSIVETHPQMFYKTKNSILFTADIWYNPTRFVNYEIDSIGNLNYSTPFFNSLPNTFTRARSSVFSGTSGYMVGIVSDNASNGYSYKPWIAKSQGNGVPLSTVPLNIDSGYFQTHGLKDIMFLNESQLFAIGRNDTCSFLVKVDTNLTLNWVKYFDKGTTFEFIRPVAGNSIGLLGEKYDSLINENVIYFQQIDTAGNLIACNSTGMEEYESNSINENCFVYPNPSFRSAINLELKSLSDALLAIYFMDFEGTSTRIQFEEMANQKYLIHTEAIENDHSGFLIIYAKSGRFAKLVNLNFD